MVLALILFFRFSALFSPLSLSLYLFLALAPYPSRLSLDFFSNCPLNVLNLLSLHFLSLSRLLCCHDLCTDDGKVGRGGKSFVYHRWSPWRPHCPRLCHSEVICGPTLHLLPTLLFPLLNSSFLDSSSPFVPPSCSFSPSVVLCSFKSWPKGAAVDRWFLELFPGVRIQRLIPYLVLTLDCPFPLLLSLW